MGRKIKLEKAEVLWKDRKRFLGIPCTFTKYYVADDRLYLKTGFFKTELNEILLYRILDIKSKRTLGQRLFGVGTITLYSADQSNRTLDLANIRKPDRVHRFLSKLVEEERVERGIVGREITGSASLDMDHMDGSCDSHSADHDIPGTPPPPPPMF